jgi:hypothetical protein
VAAVAFVSACAPSLATLQTAQVAPRGHATAAMGLEVGVPIGTLPAFISVGRGLARQGQRGNTLTDAQKWQVFDAGVNLLLEGATVGADFALTYTPLDRFEVGLRYTGGAWRVGFRYQLLDHLRAPFDLTVGVGLSRFAYPLPLSNDLPGLSIDDFSRWQLDIPILVGTSRDWFRVWGGPKVLLTSFSTQLRLSLPNDDIVARFDGDASFVGAQGGFAIGYRKLFVAFELTLAEGFGTAHLTAPSLSPPTHDTTLSNFVVFPALGFLGEF